MKLFSTSFIALGLLGIMACSNHNRTSDSILTASDVQSILQDLDGAQASGGTGGNMAAALALKDQEGAYIFVSYAPTPSLQVANVVSFLDFEYLGFPADTGIANITDARVIFIETPAHEVALIIGIKKDGGEYTYSVFTGSGGISDSSFEASMTGANNSITIKTFDLDGDELAGVIQLKLFDSGGNYLGKIATLTGFAL